MTLPRQSRVAGFVRGSLAVLGIAALLIGSPIIIIGLYRTTISMHFITPVGLFHYNDAYDAPPFTVQFRGWADDTYQALRLDLGISGLVILAFEAVFAGAWLKLVTIMLLTLWDLARNGVDALRERATDWGPRGWIASLLTTLVLSGAASPAYAATGTTRAAATAPQHPHHNQPHGHGKGGLIEHPMTPGDHTHPPPRQPSVHLPDDIRPDCARYRVHRGDTLSRIAERELGTIARWHDLARVNAFQLGSNPDHLEPGWEILLPPEAAPSKQSPTKVVTVARGDTLWSLSERELGTPNRWGELWDLNLRRTQPDGFQLSLPDRLQPGWHIVVPDEPHNKPAPDFTPTAPVPSRDPFTIDPWPDPSPPTHDGPAPSPAPPASPPRASTTAPSHPHTPAPNLVTSRPGAAITVTNGGLVAATLGGSVAVAMLIRRRRRLRAYLPNSGDRAPLPAPGPAVQALRWAYEHSHVDDDNDAQTRVLDEEPPEENSGETAIEIGISDGRVHALDLAATSGLGITGPGAPAAVRSLLVHLLATTPAGVVIPADEAHTLLGPDLLDSARLHITKNLSHTLATVDTSTPRGAPDDEESLHTVVIASADRAPSRLQGLLQVGKDRGLAAILLGPGLQDATVRVTAQGVVEATSSSLDELCGTRLFSLDAADTRDLVALFADTTPNPDPPLPAEDGRDAAFDHDPADQQQDYPPISGAEPPQSQPHTEVVAAPVETSRHNDLPSPQPHGSHDAADRTGEESTESKDPGLNDDDQRHCWSLSVLGPTALTWRGHHEQTGQDITSVLSPKHKALLVFLALHPSGTTRDAVREALWPEAGGKRPFNAFYASLSQMRKALSAVTGEQAVELISQHDEHIALNPHAVTVDYWDLHTAEREMHAASTEETRMAAWSRIATLYRGELADGMSALWLDGPREAAHRCVVDALAGMAAHYRGRDPHRQWQHLEHARLLNPDNEAIYRDIMRVQAELGLTDGISRTVNLLTSTLADINERPNPSTLTLARALQARHDDALAPSRNSDTPNADSA